MPGDGGLAQCGGRAKDAASPHGVSGLLQQQLGDDCYDQGWWEQAEERDNEHGFGVLAHWTHRNSGAPEHPPHPDNVIVLGTSSIQSFEKGKEESGSLQRLIFAINQSSIKRPAKGILVLGLMDVVTSLWMWPIRYQPYPPQLTTTKQLVSGCCGFLEGEFFGL